MTLPRLLFVDDDEMLLKGLQRSLRPFRNMWEMEFVSSGRLALETMSNNSFDVIITDMRMPEMSGAQLLEQVRTYYPQTIRFVLSGEMDRNSILSTVNPAHQYMAKPCDPEELRCKVINALALRALMENSAIKDVVSRLRSLPSLPSLYEQLLMLIESPQCTLKALGEIIDQDMAMTSKILQLVNSAFFGLGGRVSSPVQALSVLGTDTIKSLVLSLEIFSQFNSEGDNDINWLWKHSIACSRMSERVGKLMGFPRKITEECFTGGLLHDIGMLILISERRSEWRKIIDLARKEEISTVEAEYKVLGCSHSEIGAYLIGIWGLPSSIVEAAAWHHHPSQSAVSQPSVLLAVHLAEISHLRKCAETSEKATEITELDQEFVERCGVADRSEDWIKECMEMNFEEPSHEH